MINFLMDLAIALAPWGAALKEGQSLAAAGWDAVKL